MPAGVLAFPVPDTTDLIEGSADPTKILRIEVDGFTTATTRTMTIPDASFTVAGLSIANVFTTIQTIDLSSNVKGLVIQEDASQTANIVEVQDSSGNRRLYIGYDDPLGANSDSRVIGLRPGTRSYTFGTSDASGAMQFVRSDTSNGFQVVPESTRVTFGMVSGSSAAMYILATDAGGLNISGGEGGGAAVIHFGRRVSDNSASVGTSCRFWSITGQTTPVIGTVAPGQGVAGTVGYRHAIDLEGDVYFKYESSTTNARDRARVLSGWISNTDASRTGYLALSSYYITTAQEGLRIASASTGCVVTIGNDANFDGLVINENGEDADTRIEGDTATKLFVCDASADAVQIGTTTAGALANFTPTQIIFNQAKADCDFFFFSQNDEKLLCGDASTDNVGVGIHPPAVKFHVFDHDSNTTTVVRSMIVEIDSSGTPAVGFGTEMAFRLATDTTDSRDAASIYTSWLNATETSQRASLVLSAYYITTAQEGFRIDGTKGGCLVTIGNDANYGGLVINEGSADADTRIESNGNTHAVFVDAGNDRVGIFNSSPSTPLDVTGNTTIRGTAGENALRIVSSTTDDDPNYAFRQTRTTTTDATVTTIDTIAITSSRTYKIKVSVVARRTGGSSGAADDGAIYERCAMVTTKSSVVTINTTGDQPIDIEDQAGWDVTFAVSGSNALIQVTGAASNNITWHCTAIVQHVSGAGGEGEV